MGPIRIAVPRVIAAGLAAGAWVFASGLLMAAAFGYRDMSAAFSRIGLEIPGGAATFVTHTVVRFGYGITIATLFAILAPAMTRARAVLMTAALTWILGSLFPWLIVTEWGLFPWSVALKIWSWSAGEFLIASWLASRICTPQPRLAPGETAPPPVPNI